MDVGCRWKLEILVRSGYNKQSMEVQNQMGEYKKWANTVKVNLGSGCGVDSEMGKLSPLLPKRLKTKQNKQTWKKI